MKTRDRERLEGARVLPNREDKRTEHHRRSRKVNPCPVCGFRVRMNANAVQWRGMAAHQTCLDAEFLTRFEAMQP